MPTGLGDEQLWLSATNDNTGTSTAFNDQSGNGNNGTASGTLVVANTSEGGTYAYEHDGSNDYIDCGTSVISNTTFSISGWFNTDASWSALAGNYRWQSGLRSFYVRLNNLTPEFLIASVGTSSSGNVSITSSSSVSTGTWYHIAATWDSVTGDMKLFLDGSLVASGTQSVMAASTEPLCLGSYSVVEGFFNGKQDDFRFYQRTLTQAEITHLASSRGVEGPPPVGLGDEKIWLCPSLNGSADDLSGNGKNGTLQGGLGVTNVAGQDAFDFDGIDDYISLPANIGGSSEDEFSFSYWYKRNGGGDIHLFNMAGDGTNTNNVGISSYWQGGGNADAHQHGARSALSYAAGGWAGAGSMVHICVTSDGTDLKFYADGTLISTNTTTTNIDMTYAGRIGSYGSVIGGVEPSNVDDFRIYTRGLTQAEVVHLSEARGIEGPPPVGLGDEKLWLCPSINDSANDISGNGNNGTYQGGMGTVTDTSNGGSLAYSFDGTDDYIDVVSSGVPATAYSVSLWQYSTGGGVTTMFNAGDATSKRNINIDGVRAGNSGDNHGHQSSGTFYLVGNTVTRSSATWYHYTLTYDGSTLRLYVDGQLVNSLASVPNTTYTETKCWIGQYIGGSYRFTGRADDIRTYDRALTQAEIAHLAEARGIEGPPPVGLGDEKLWLCPSINDSANDISGNGNNGIYNGGMGTVVDTSNGGSLAYDFDGTNDSIVIDNNIEFGGNSVSCWVYSDNIALRFREIECYDKSRSTGNPDLVLQHETAAGQRAFSQVSGTAITPYTVINQSQWYHLCSVLDGTNLSVYIDGTLAASVAYTPIPQSDYMRVGARGTGIEHLDGKMDDIRAYDRALTQSEITHLATSRGIEGGPTFTGLGDEQLWLCPSLDDSANDISGYGNNGTYNGGMATVADTGSGGTRAYDFDGVDDRITVPQANFDFLRETNYFSTSAWVKADSVSGQRTIIGGDLNTANYGIFVANDPGTGGVRCARSDGATPYSPNTNSSTNITASQWTHVCWVVDNTTSTLYLDGVQIFQETGTFQTSTGSLTDSVFIGCFIFGGTLYSLWDGLQDDIRIYDRALTQAEITHLSTSRGIEGSPSTPTTQHNAFITHAFKQLFQTRLR
jgi:hypothetical protein